MITRTIIRILIITITTFALKIKITVLRRTILLLIKKIIILRKTAMTKNIIIIT